MDLDLIKAVIGAGGMTSLFLLGVWQLLKRALDGFSQAIDTINKLHEDRTNHLERKLDACEKRHEEAYTQLARLREDYGILKGRVQGLELLTSHR